jgi:hypothetical protein
MEVSRTHVRVVPAGTDRFGGLDGLAIAGFAAAGAILVVQATAQLVDFWVFDLRLTALDDNTDGASNAFAWVSVALMLATAISYGRIAMISTANRRLAGAIAGLLAFLIVDNRVHIHDRVAHGKLLFVPVAGTLFVLLWRFSAAQTPLERLLIRCGLGFLVVSFVVHLFGHTALSWGGWHVHDWEYQLKIVLKESSEKAGWVLVFFGGLAHLRALRLRTSPAGELA